MANPNHALQPLQILQARWAAMAPREQRGVRLAGVLIALALVWSVLLSPALRILQKAPAQHQALDAELDRMLRLQLRARALQGQTAVSAEEAIKGLQLAAAELGAAATVRVLGEQATLTLQHLDAKALGLWLSQPGAASRLQLVEMHLLRDPGDKPAWSGTLTYLLPQGGSAAR